MIEERLQNYNEQHCWQYDIRLKNGDTDLQELPAGILPEQLTIKDFTLQFEEKADVFNEAKAFIEKHEWLGKLGLYPTHIFTARVKGILAGVVIMDMPGAFSKLLGEDTRKIERWIGRGACVSWSPKNLASALIMYSIKWMVKNTRFRLFTAFADPMALELGTIYQACNFYYLGQKAGTRYQFLNDRGNWVSDRYFRSRSIYKKIAKQLGYDWQDEWQVRDRVDFHKMPIAYAESIKGEAKAYMKSCDKRTMKLKHKYAYVLGIDKRETRDLRRLFIDRNKVYDYPKERGV